MQIEQEEAIVVGVNAFQSDEPLRMKRLRVDPEIEAEQRARLEQLRARRQESEATGRLEKLKQAAEGDENLMPHFIACVQADVTLGEICQRLREVWGEYQAPATL
jgi:methylmalonyl-CoA mutase N-terminal domain/subunit